VGIAGSPAVLFKFDMGEVGGVFRRLVSLEPAARDTGRMLAEWDLGEDRVEAIVDAGGTQTVRVGVRVVSRLPHRAETTHAFTLGASACTVRYDTAARTWTLTRDGVVLPPTVHAVAGSVATLPRWARPFVWGCMLMPLVTLGGLVPMLVGFGCATGCAAAARATKLSMAVRVTLCALLLVITWATFTALVMASKTPQ
jgi:hypothetical protein